MADFLKLFELPVFVFALIANIVLAWVVLQYAAQRKSRIYFLVFVLSQVFWITVNFLAFRVSADSFLFVSRLTMFFATFHAFSFYLFVKGFLAEKKKNFDPYTIFLFASGMFVAYLTLTSYVFKQIIVNSDGVLAPQTGPLIPIFGLFVGVCVSSAVYLMIRRYKEALGEQKAQWKYIMSGFSITFAFVVIFSFLGFVVFEKISTVRFGHLYTLPFLVFTSYAIIKHKFLNVKAVLAEIMVIILNAIIFLQLINSVSVVQYVISGLVLAGTLVGGVLLIKSVRKEVQQKEQLQILSNNLSNANEQLKSLDKARAEFISVASHQLRTPPATIKWYLAAVLAGDYGKMSPKIRLSLEKAQLTNNNQIGLIDDMLNASRIERGKMEFLFEFCDLVKLVETSTEQLIPQAKMKKLSLSFIKPKTKFPQILADKEKLSQVINNIIDNSIKYTKSGSVKVELTKTKTDFVIKVTDTGKGMSPDEKNSIFEKYGRGNNSQKHSSGLGLGLYVAKIVVEHHKGQISAESQGEGKGSSFIVTLPIKTNLKAESFDFAKPA